MADSVQRRAGASPAPYFATSITAAMPTPTSSTTAHLPPPRARWCYRLRQLDADGTATFSPVRAVAVPASRAVRLQLWPNPARGPVSVVGGATGEVVQLLDLTGRVLGRAVLPATGPFAAGLARHSRRVRGAQRQPVATPGRGISRRLLAPSAPGPSNCPRKPPNAQKDLRLSV